MLPELVISDDIESTRKYIKKQCIQLKCPNLIYYGDEEPLNIEVLRGIVRDALKPSLSTTAYILMNFDVVPHDAQNTLLKILEEHNQNVLLFLVAKDEYAILPTISSRCKRVYALSQNENEALLIKKSGLLNKNTKLPEVLLFSSTLSKEKHSAFITEIRSFLYDQIHDRKNTLSDEELFMHYQAIEKIITVERQLKNNIYPEFTLDYVLFYLFEHKLIPFAQS